jgi:hypothetical protein
MYFHFPIDGDMLNSREGTLRDNCLYVQVKIIAHPNESLLVNGIPAVYDGSYHTVEIPLYGYRNMISAYNTFTNETIEISVYWLKTSTYKTRLSLDDNILCLRDLTKNADKYNSVFDNPYFALYKNVHDTFGTKVHMNVYYQCENFNISMLPDKYKPEFIANSDWLQFLMKLIIPLYTRLRNMALISHFAHRNTASSYPEY